MNSFAALPKTGERSGPRQGVEPAHRGQRGSLDAIHELRGVVGNQAVLRLLRAGLDERREARIQPKLTIGAVDDPLEREADAVADQVMRTPEPGSQCPHLEHRPSSGQAVTAMRTPAYRGAFSRMDLDEVSRGIDQARPGGHPLGEPVRGRMEAAFGANFAQVRTHTDARAAALAASLRAQAFTSGHDVFFAAGRYNPNSHSGRRLLAHELTHALQQGAAPAAPAVAVQRKPDDSELHWVSVGLATQPRQKPSPASDQATPENQQLAAEIDAVEQLSDADLLKSRRELQSENLSKDDRQRDLLTLQATEFVAHRRELAPAKFETPPTGLSRKSADRLRRFNVRALIETGIRETGSLKRALTLYPRTGEVEGEYQAIEAEAATFAQEFKGQARMTAERMLDSSLKAMGRVLESYGLPRYSAGEAAKRVVRGESVEDEADQLAERAKSFDEFPAARNLRHRSMLAKWVKRLKQQQARVNALQKQDNQATFNAPISGTGPAWDALKKVHNELAAARIELGATWIQAERLHPLLAAYRSGGPLEKIDLGKLDAGPEQQQVSAILVPLLSRIADIGRAQQMIWSGRLSPLTLPPVVALTSTNMFIPDGSIRAGVVLDLVEAEKAKREPFWVEVATLVLAIVTLVPSLGASLAIPAGMAVVGMATYSTLKIIQRYEQQKTLIDTDLDRARALSDEEPSLTGLAMQLVSIGLEGIPLFRAFQKVRNIRRLVNEGLDVTREVRELNRFSKNAPHLGDDALANANAASRKPAAPPETTPPSGDESPSIGSDEARTPHDETTPATKEESRTPATEETKPAKVPKEKAPLPPYPKVSTLALGTRKKVKEAVSKAFAGLKSGMEEASLPGRYLKMVEALKASGKYQEIVKLAPEVMRSLRDPDLWGEVMADAWTTAKNLDTDINAALLRMTKDKGIAIKVIKRAEGQMEGGTFFDLYGGTAASIVDRPLAASLAGDLHGSMTHLVQDLVVNQGLRSKGVTSGSFRTLLGGATDMVKLPWSVAKGEAKMVKFGDLVWRAIYDVEETGQMPMPEAVFPKLHTLFGLD
jgi:hypothetical protein